MRGHKFRAWTGSQMEHNVMAGWLGAFYVQGIDAKDSASMSPSNTVFPEQTPLMQYTGLKDKNGVEIYEGDIVQFADKWEWHRGSFGGGFFASKDDYEEVLSNHEKYPYERRTVKLPEDYSWLLSSEIQSYWEVIGNIYENPELLEVVA
ncbi:YopX family protein [Pseudarthrobacter sp. H2]|uniref:YopX family protein n=1 Tax=Pseudarthrobacter sp. H2 TaxID=3418415 RepID=UPI003CF0A8B7